MAIVITYTTVVTMVYKPTNRTGPGHHIVTQKNEQQLLDPYWLIRFSGDSMRGQPIMKNMRMFDISDK